MSPAPLLAVLAGLLQTISLATPWDGQPLWWLQLLACIALACLLLDATSLRRAAGLGWLFGSAWLGSTFGWLYTSLHTYGGLAAPLALVAVLALAAVLSLYLAAACAVFYHFRHTHWALCAIVFGAINLLNDLARAQWFTGFPWGAAGYAHVDGPLVAYAPWVGVYGIGAIAATLAMLLVQALRRWGGGSAPASLALALLLAGLLPWGLGQLNAGQNVPALSAGRLPITLLQGNIPQGEKFEQGSGIPLALQWYGQALRSAVTPLVVAPETALPLLPGDMPVDYWPGLQQHVDASGHAALIGTPLGSFADGYTNSVRGLVPGQTTPYRYDKHHLVPFGEFIPPLFKWFTQMMRIPLGDFNRGAVGQASFEWQGQRIAPNICYEDLFGEELATRFVQADAAPTILVNLSNLAWFGDGQAIDQHLQISRLRSLELARPMVRATNTGATVVIDHQGVITHQLPRSTRGVLVAEVEGRLGITPYAWVTARWGLWPWWLGGILGLIAAAWGRRRRA
ncbi:MAG: hypothetical protein RLZZ401_591 [Pseudomonadota bacterium]